jgi:hypothetical protein
MHDLERKLKDSPITSHHGRTTFGNVRKDIKIWRMRWLHGELCWIELFQIRRIQKMWGGFLSYIIYMKRCVWRYHVFNGSLRLTMTPSSSIWELAGERRENALVALPTTMVTTKLRLNELRELTREFHNNLYTKKGISQDGGGTRLISQIYHWCHEILHHLSSWK